jgi:hypothetical protein
VLGAASAVAEPTSRTATDTVACMIAFHSVTVSDGGDAAMGGASAMPSGSTRASTHFDFTLLMVISLFPW